MVANELRENNLLNSRKISISSKKSTNKIISLTWYGIYNLSKGLIKDLQPIRLTPEILTMACGFILMRFGEDKDCYVKDYLREEEVVPKQRIVLVKLSDPRLGYAFCIENIPNNAKVSVNSIKYLHELQNLFYFTTKQELTIDIIKITNRNGKDSEGQFTLSNT